MPSQTLEQLEQQADRVLSKYEQLSKMQSFGQFTYQQQQQQQQQGTDWQNIFALDQANPNQSMTFSAGQGIFPQKLEAGTNLLPMVLGAAFSGIIGGILGRFLPLGQFTILAAGIIGRMLVKNRGFARDFFTGVLIAGAAVVLSSLLGGALGGVISGAGTTQTAAGFQDTGSMITVG